MRNSVKVFILAVLLNNGCAVEQQKLDATYATTRRALITGDVKATLSAYEAQAAEAERNASASWFPQQYWETATLAYCEASRLAGISGQFQKAIGYGEKALGMAEKTNKPEYQIFAITMLNDAYRGLRNFSQAKELIQKGFEVIKKIPSSTIARSTWETALYLRLGLDLMQQRAYEKAIDAFSQAVYFAEDYLNKLRAGNKAWIEDARTTVVLRLISLANAYRQAGRFPQALEQYQLAFERIKAWGLKYAYEDNLYWNMGELYRRQKNYPEALKNFQNALALAESRGMANGIASASRSVGYVFLYHLRKPSEAIPYYAKGIQVIESTRSLLESEEYRRSYFEGGLGAYESMIRALLEVGNDKEAFEYSEKARSRAFLDVLGSKVQLSRVNGGLFAQEKALRERIAAIKGRLASEVDGETNRTDLGKDLAAAERAYNAFLAKVRSQDKEQASLMSVEPLSLTQVQERLDPGVTLLEYFVSNSNLWLWVVEKERFEFVSTTIARKDLVSKVTDLRDAIYQLGEKERFNVLSQELHKLLIQPALPHIRGKQLIIVPHDVLHYLPFQALLGSDNRYLIEKYPIYYLSSASLMQFTQQKRLAMGDKVLAFGNPDLDDPKMALQFAEVEAGEIKKLYPQSTLLLKKEATEEKAKLLSPQNDIIHFASHAELNEDDPLASAIRLAKSEKEDGRLEVREIFGMDLKASLVVLSACETGLGKLSSGDELVGLTRAFIYAGTPSVIASLWNVEDSSTAQLMASFYKNLKTMTKVEALRQAQLNLIRGNVNSDLLARRGIGGVGKLGEVPVAKAPSQDSNPIAISTSHPFFWAPFILVGEGK